MRPNLEDCSLKIWNLKGFTVNKIQTIIIQEIGNAILKIV